MPAADIRHRLSTRLSEICKKRILIKLKIKDKNCLHTRVLLCAVPSVACLLNVLPKVLQYFTRKYLALVYDQDARAHAMPIPHYLPYLAGICCLLGLESEDLSNDLVLVSTF